MTAEQASGEKSAAIRAVPSRGAANLALQDPILVVEDLRVVFPTRQGAVQALNGVSFAIGRNEILGLVGETGSGKSVTAASIMGLLRPPGRILGGSIQFNGAELTRKSDRQMNELRGSHIALVVQNVRSSLNPLITVGRQMMNVYQRHERSATLARVRMLEMLDAVGFADPNRVARSYVHQLSGGMAQRVVIAIALGTSPKLVIADEPTTGLDASIQVEVLDLMTRMIKEVGASGLLITHDLGIVATYCQKVAVMHAGEIVESSGVGPFFQRPLHPYGRGLLNALAPDPLTKRIMVMGSAPDLIHLPSGCTYRLRCPLAAGRCAVEDPADREVITGHWVSCHRAEDLLEAEG